ncbi:MAG: hypothetical protein JWP63_6318 [Candidatus Solibacter sp.]|nr:hypothetical protein [Candidatus Solibacter sp.]
MNSMRAALAAVICSAAVFAQPAPTRAEFEVVSIKPSPPPVAGQVNAGVKVDGAQVHARFLALADYIQSAYKVKNYQVVGPSWLGAERFEIDAKLPEGAKREQVPEMLQSLLADRFDLKFHRETKDFPVYALTVSKGGIKMDEIAIDPEEAKGNVEVAAQGGQGGTTVNLGHGSSFSIGANGTIAGTRLTMTQFADLLARFTEKPVVDMTGLKGGYTFTLQFTPEEFRAMMIRAAIAAGAALPPEALRLLDGASDDGLLAALQRLGLKLENRKAPLEVIVVDHILRTPKEN